MYIESPEGAKRFMATLKRKLARISGVEVWVAPPFTILPVVPKGPYKLGGQHVSTHTSGAHTGEVSASMLKSAGASFCIVGHSERRAMGEGDDVVHEELLAALKAGLVAVLCVGEEERRDDGWHFVHIEAQLRTALVGTHPFAHKIIVAYEPIWAIGKNASEAMQPQTLEEMVIFIKKTLSKIIGREAGLKIPILYGGSVEDSNCVQLLHSGINGLLVGHASADINSFSEILSQCKK